MHTATLGATADMVIKLLGDLKGKGYPLFRDNWYMSLPLCDYLKTDDTGVCGTMQANRQGIPLDIKQCAVPKGQFAFRRRRDVLLLKLHDKKVIFLISIFHNIVTVRTGNRNHHSEHIVWLKVNHNYNCGMSGVDRNDMMISCFTAFCKTLKWYKKLGMHFLEEAMQNAYVVYKLSPGNKLDHFRFLAQACHHLLNQGGIEISAAQAGADQPADRSPLP